MLAGLLAERRRQPTDPPDFLQLLTEAGYRDGTPVPDLVRVNLILMLTWAGHETTTGHLAWALIDLLQHPGELDAVRRELQAEIDDAPLSPTQVHRLKHLDRALHETERLHPVAYILQRTADEDFERDGHLIPAGTKVFISPAVSHRLADVYPEPDQYQPGRFLANPRSMRDLVGFGGGVHRCLGVHFAYLEMTVVLARLLQWFDLELQDTDPRPVAGPKTKWPALPCRGPIPPTCADTGCQLTTR